ncbi:MAG: hypothetical protein IT364_10480 [Candidatus Hydrogenedentes bacterium]|nr:hypothetical protein [Candidatus Hydrogenedentota bacterium]
MESKQRKRNPIPFVSLAFSLVASVWMLLGATLGHMGPPWPCVLGGVVLLGAGFALYLWPEYRLEAGLVIIIAALFVFMLGAGGIVPGLLGIVGGASAVASRDSGDGALAHKEQQANGKKEVIL